MKRFFVSILSVTTLLAQIPVGYYDSVAGSNGSALQQALHDIIDNHAEQSYTSLWTHYQTTDARPDSANAVWDMYSDIPGSDPPYWLIFVDDQDRGSGGTVEGDKYNREHSWPSSWFDKATPIFSDLFHVYPTDKYVNNRRSNYPYGEVSNPSWTSANGSKLGTNTSSPEYTGTVFEPIDTYKGDFARSYLYMATRYLNEDSGWPGSDMVDGSQLKSWALDLMLDWHAADTVSQKEIDRNNAVYGIQNNRNPFIDHPEYSNSIWGGSYPVSINSDPLEQPIYTRLLPTYPNPFNAGTMISFDLKYATQIRLDVFNLQGQWVSKLVDQQMDSGDHVFQWSGNDNEGGDLSSGLYLLRLSTPENSTIQRVTILR